MKKKKIQPNKICVVCGNEYTPIRCDQLTCSKDCRVIHNLEVKKIKSKEYYHYKPTGKCKICGEIVHNQFLSPFRRTSAHMHDECVFEDCLKTLEAGESLNHVQLLRLQARGYTAREFKEEYMGIEDTTKADWSKIETGFVCLN